jgi:hypothetical protein
VTHLSPSVLYTAARVSDRTVITYDPGGAERSTVAASGTVTGEAHGEDIVATYQREGYGPALAKFIQLIMHTGPLPPAYLDRPAPNPAAFGLPTTDDGSRDDPLLSRNLAMPPFQPDLAALRAARLRDVLDRP